MFAPSAALVGSTELRDLLAREPAMADVVRAWSRLTLALVGIGSLAPSPLLRRSGNAITARDQRQLKELGAVGDMCARYFDADGDPVDAPFNDRLVGIDPDRCARWNAGSEWRAAPTGRRRSAARHAAGGSTS